MKAFASCLVVSGLLLFAQKAMSQTFDPEPSDSAQNRSAIRMGVRYTSDYYYMGRSDSAAAPYFSATLGYFHKSGLFIRSSLSYLTASAEQRVDLVTLSAGYDYFDTKLAAGGSVTEYFFSDLSYAVQAEMRTYLNGYIGYDLSIFMLYADASVGFSEGTDFFLGGEISRTFYASGNKLRITPALYLNAGTQKYYDAYYSDRSMQTGSGPRNGKGHGGPQTPITEQLRMLSPTNLNCSTTKPSCKSATPWEKYGFTS